MRTRKAHLLHSIVAHFRIRSQSAYYLLFFVLFALFAICFLFGLPSAEPQINIDKVLRSRLSAAASASAAVASAASGTSGRQSLCLAALLMTFAIIPTAASAIPVHCSCTAFAVHSISFAVAFAADAAFWHLVICAAATFASLLLLLLLLLHSLSAV